MVFVRGGGVPRASTTMDLPVVAINCYRPQTKFPEDAKVMFLQVSVCPQGGGMWQGVCMTGACMAGACVAGACVAGGHAWQGGFVARGVCGGGHA